MPVYIYRRAPSEGAVLLARQLTAEGIPAHKVRELTPWRIARASAVICWGDPAPPGVRHTLNGQPNINKLEELCVLAAADVPAVEVSTRDLGAGWIGRAAFHVGGNDLLVPTRTPAFWTRREAIAKEYRLHIFRGRSIRAGRKDRYRDDAHEWIRSYNAGWRIVYDGHGVTDRHRSVAKSALEALGLDFGAVDIGERPDGSVVVFEVNRAPGIEGNSVATYARYIREWYGGLDNDR